MSKSSLTSELLYSSLDSTFIHNSMYCVQWLADVNQKVMLENGSSVPVILLANKVLHHSLAR